MSTRTITREQATDWGLPDDLTAANEDAEPGIAIELARIEDTGRRRWASENDLVFRAPDDGRTYRVTYFRGLTETQEDHDEWNDERTLELVEVEPVSVPVVEWHRVGDKTPPAEPEGDTTSAPAPTGDVFTEAAIRRSAYLDAANALADPGPNTCGCLGCAECALHRASQDLRRLADHYTTAEQPTGPTWEARADHAVRLYARTAIELEDAKAEAARLRAERTELIAQRDRIADDTIKALAAEPSLVGLARRLAEQITTLGKARGWSTWAADFIHPDREFVDTGEAAAPSIPGIRPSVVYVDELQLGATETEQCAQHPGAPRIGDMCGGCTQYPADMTQPTEYSTGPDGEPTYHHRDVDGDRLLISPSFIPGTGIGLYFRTDAAGSSVPAAALPTLLARLTPLLDYAREHIADEEVSG
ncbi:hypothetical protein ABZT27_34410 [Streptomyces sp. NPDC005389]|uniref:hypothetical protein n=1 Tax=Streptomyces sp. NPDC005389 TaxID=3157040 RepID=UPI0033B7B569